MPPCLPRTVGAAVWPCRHDCHGGCVPRACRLPPGLATRRRAARRAAPPAAAALHSCIRQPIFSAAATRRRARRAAHPLAPCSVRALILLDLTSDPCLPSVMPCWIVAERRGKNGRKGCNRREYGWLAHLLITHLAQTAGCRSALPSRGIASPAAQMGAEAGGLGFHAWRCVRGALSMCKDTQPTIPPHTHSTPPCHPTPPASA